MKGGIERYELETVIEETVPGPTYMPIFIANLFYLYGLNLTITLTSLISLIPTY